MDAVLKHLGLRSDFIVCHADVIDDPLLHAPRPPPAPPSPPHPRPPPQPLSLHPPMVPSMHSLHIYWGFLNISTISMDPGLCH